MNNLKLNILLGVFVGLLVGMTLLGGKITTLFGVSVSVAIFMVPLTFLITDIVADVYGKKISQQFIIAGVITLIMVLLYTALFVWLEPHERFAENNGAYITIFKGSLRIIVASIIAFILAQFHDIWAFHFWKKKTKGKALWLRNNLSTFVSQAIDTFVFMMIAFYHVTPKFTFGFILELAVVYYLFKIVFAIIDTPLVYLGVWWLKKGQKQLQNKTSPNSV